MVTNDSKERPRAPHGGKSAGLFLLRVQLVQYLVNIYSPDGKMITEPFLESQLKKEWAVNRPGVRYVPDPDEINYASQSL